MDPVYTRPAGRGKIGRPRGIGAVGTAILGIFLFAESAAPARLACIALIVAGIIGLKLTRV